MLSTKLLIVAGADIHRPDDNGRTMLHRASLAGWVEIVQCLVNRGAALDVKDSFDATPLLYAANCSHPEVVKLLINSGADIHCCDDDGTTLLHKASIHGWLEIVQILVSKGAALDSIGFGGSTPLSCAIISGKTEIALYLLRAGANCNLPTKCYLPPFSLLFLERNPNVELIKLCIEKGAYVNFADHYKLLKDSLLKKVVLQDVKLCVQAYINEFNYRDLPLLYKGLVSAQKLPFIDRMKIRHGSGTALAIEQAVAHEIQTKGFCNLFNFVPPVLSFFCVKSWLERSTSKNQLELQNDSTRVRYCNEQEYPCKRMRVDLL